MLGRQALHTFLSAWLSIFLYSHSQHSLQGLPAFLVPCLSLLEAAELREGRRSPSLRMQTIPTLPTLPLGSITANLGTGPSQVIQLKAPILRVSWNNPRPGCFTSVPARGACRAHHTWACCGSSVPVAAGAASFLEFLIAPGPGDWLFSSDPTWAAAWLDKKGISLGLQSIRHRRGHLGPTSRSGKPGGRGLGEQKTRGLSPSKEPGDDGESGGSAEQTQI